jgi:hypothetical protein
MPHLMNLDALKPLRFSFLFLPFFFTPDGSAAQTIHHYVFFNMERERIAETSFLATKAFEGAQLKYTWKELEPEKDTYCFTAIHKDLSFLTARGKKLFIQFQDVSFDTSVVNVPTYLIQDPIFHGGVAMQFETDSHGQAEPGGWVARRWDPAVQERLHRLFDTLGREFDGRIEGINLPETSVSFGENAASFPQGFTFKVYRDAVIANMKALKKAFVKSVTMLYANFMPGEWLPSEDHSYLRSIFRSATDLGIGLGGPDLLPYKKGQMNNGYRFLRECKDLVPSGIAVQDGNYDYINPQTEQRVTIRELIQFASDSLRVKYLFWCTEEPYYSRDLLPLMKTMR